MYLLPAKTSSKKDGSSKHPLLPNSVKYYYYLTATVIIVLLSALCLETYSSQKKILGINTSNIIEEIKINEEITYWKSFLEKNPTYYDGWKRLSDLYLFINNQEESKTTLNTARQINPN